MQAFRVICHCMHMEPTMAKFLHYYVIHMGVKSGWVSLIGLSKTCLFKGRFMKDRELMVKASPIPAKEAVAVYHAHSWAMTQF
ncbi:hypothetical protein CR513_61473, partial [Mucuna pruriens]